MLRVGMVASLLLGGIPLASAGECEPLGEAEFLKKLDAAARAIDDANVEAHQVVTEHLRERIPCLDFVPSPDKWAELMVGIAIVAFVTDEDWQQPLETALHIAPGVDRLVGVSHPIATWEPPPLVPPTEQVIPEGVRLFYDGEIVTRVPETGGLHLVQLRTGDGISSRLVDNEAIPASWLELPELSKRRWRPGWGYLGLGAGVAYWGQRPSVGGDWLTREDEVLSAVGPSAHGWLRLYRRLGMRFDVAAPSLTPQMRMDASLGLGASTGRLSLSAGAVVTGATVRSGGVDEQTWFVLPEIGAVVRPLDDGRLMTSLSVGWLPAMLRFHLRGAWTFAVATGVEPYLGLDLRSSWATYEQPVEPVREVVSSSVIASVEFGLAWGRRDR